MKKRVMIFIGILICLFFTSCRHIETYSFLNSTDDISSISIVKITFNEDGGIIETEIEKINDINAFISDFRKIDCYKYYGDPIGITVEGVEDTVIKVLYENDEYELINWSGQAEYTQERGFKYYAGFNVFNEEQFEALITKYMCQ